MNHKAEDRSCMKLPKSCSTTLQVKIFGYTVVIIRPRYRLCLTDEDNHGNNNDMVYLNVCDHRWACSGLVGCDTTLRMRSRGFDYRFISFQFKLSFQPHFGHGVSLQPHQKSVTVFLFFFIWSKVLEHFIFLSCNHILRNKYRSHLV
jgi:hypothetical protein